MTTIDKIKLEIPPSGPERIAYILKSFREAFSLTTTQLAKHLGLPSASTISSWEKGEKSPGYPNQQRICLKLQISLQTLLGLPGKEPLHWETACPTFPKPKEHLKDLSPSLEEKIKKLFEDTRY